MLFTVYILQSLKDGSLYVGHTNNLPLRLTQHNDPHRAGYASKRGPWVLRHCEDYSNRSAAAGRERFLKSCAGAKEKRRLAAAGAGLGGKPMQYITEYNNTWPESFEKISQTIRAELLDGCQVHHIGSTAIPGMPAKDIIDLVIECPAGSISAVIRALGMLGYEHQGDLGIRGREAFRAPPGSLAVSLPPHHLYACEESAFELRKSLAFRDFLNTHRDRMIWLAEQKRLADHGAKTRDEYIQNKAQAYLTITAEALEWAAGAGKGI